MYSNVRMERKYTIDDIRKLNPCYDPTIVLPIRWEGTAADLLKDTSIPAVDRFWAVMNLGALSVKVQKEFNLWCVSQVEGCVKNQQVHYGIEALRNYDRGDRYVIKECRDYVYRNRKGETEVEALANDVVYSALFGYSSWVFKSMLMFGKEIGVDTGSNMCVKLAELV